MTNAPLAACGRVSDRSLLAKPERLRRAVYALLEVGLLEVRDGEVFRRGGPAPIVRLHGEKVLRRERKLDIKTPPPAVAKADPKPQTRPSAEEDHSHYAAADHEQRTALTALLERLSRPARSKKLRLMRDATEAEIRSAYVMLARDTRIATREPAMPCTISPSAPSAK
jgi:hypothetical protein